MSVLNTLRKSFASLHEAFALEMARGPKIIFEQSETHLRLIDEESDAMEESAISSNAIIAKCVVNFESLEKMLAERRDEDGVFIGTCFQALRELQTSLFLLERFVYNESSLEKTKDIVVVASGSTVKTFNSVQFYRNQKYFKFSESERGLERIQESVPYSITITNQGQDNVKLLRRKWHIWDLKSETEKVIQGKFFGE